MVDAIRRHGYRLLVVDDNSPDGTGTIADELASADQQVAVLHRTAKAGLGPAYAEGFQVALGDDVAKVVVQMDADFSHDPDSVSDLVVAVRQGADVAIGSRYVPGGSMPDWPWYRKAISRTGNWYANVMLRLGVADCTAGFRAWSADALRQVDVSSAEASGYGFQVEMTRRARDAGFSIVERPISFRDRQFGVSKMGLGIVVEAMWLVTRWGFDLRMRGQSG